MVSCGVENESENIDKYLLERIKGNNLGLRHVSSKFSNKEGITNAIKINFYRENQLHFEALKGVTVENDVEHKGEKEKLNNYFRKKK